VLTSRNQTAQVTSPTNWAAVGIALIKSLHKGVFFDRKYWVRHSKAGGVLKPIYFSSIIMDGKAQQLNKCTSKFGCAHRLWVFAICASGNSNKTEHGLPFDSPTITLFEILMARYTQQHSILITSRYSRSFLDPGWETIGNSVAPYLAKGAVNNRNDKRAKKQETLLCMNGCGRKKNMAQRMMGGGEVII